MHVILNSDILYSQHPIRDKLPRHLEDFARKAGQAGATLVIPLTALKEFEHNQSKISIQAASEIEKAVGLLQKIGLHIPEVDAKSYCIPGNLVTLLESTGIKTIVTQATFDEYADAEHRACHHLSPQPPETKSDEMRDLVIWNIALRVSAERRGALLVSKDVVHVDDRGSAEANSVLLNRAKSLDEALEIIGVASPAGSLARAMLTPFWERLQSEGLPIAGEVSIKKVLNPTFRQGVSGVEAASFDVGFSGLTSAEQLSAHAEIVLGDEQILTLTDLQLNKSVWKTGGIVVSMPRLHDTVQAADDRLESLRDIFRS